METFLVFCSRTNLTTMYVSLYVLVGKYCRVQSQFRSRTCFLQPCRMNLLIAANTGEIWRKRRRKKRKRRKRKNQWKTRKWKTEFSPSIPFQGDLRISLYCFVGTWFSFSLVMVMQYTCSLTLSLRPTSTPTGVETPDVIDLRKLQRKETDKQAERPLYQVSRCLWYCWGLWYLC